MLLDPPITRPSAEGTECVHKVMMHFSLTLTPDVGWPTVAGYPALVLSLNDLTDSDFGLNSIESKILKTSRFKDF